MNAPLLPEQVKAARALLAWSQQELAAKARVGTSTVADFERGVRTPVANNAQAIRDALEAQGLQFVAGGVVEKAMLPTPVVARPGGLMRWVNATHLSQWGERRDGQSGVPELIRRLIYVTVGPSAAMRFPSDESVQHSGWDGVCKVDVGLSYVPGGDSVWEMGTQRKSIRKKADDDFLTRIQNPLGCTPAETTFVFVTPQRFSAKDAWVAEKKALGIWRDVKVVDADDLVHWLEMYPAVAQWLAVRIGRRPEGLRNLEEVWLEWTGATRMPSTEDVLLTGRDQDQTAILKWLRAPAQQVSVQAESPDEALAFLYAAISPLPDSYRLWHLSRCVVADDVATARQLLGLGTPLIVVLVDPEPGLAQHLVDDGHHVFAAYGSDVVDYQGNLRRLRRPWKFDLQTALIQAGMSDEDAHRYAHASGRSITVLRRLMPAAPHLQLEWAQKASPELIAAMFAGAWLGTSSQDRMVISELAGRPYEQVEEVLASLATAVGGPIVRSGDLWKVVSLRDLWTQIGGQVTPSQLSRFEAVFHNVLGAINPRFATRPKSIYYEADGEFEEQPSVALRNGLTEVMIAMGVFPERAALVSGIGGHVDRAVRKLFDNASGSLWWSLSRDFQNLAEAAPGAFLDAVESGLEGTDPPIMSLFRNDEGMLHSTEYLSSLLWALEMLARSPEHLGRSALLLVRLHEVDPGGEWSNRPFASLRRIFLNWSPQTYATLPERLKVIDVITRLHPAVGWNLLLALAPRSDDSSTPSSKPKWRDFTPDAREEITWPAVAVAASAIGERLLAHVGQVRERWHSLLDLWSSFDEHWRALAADQLTAFAHQLADPGEIEEMRDKLRSLLMQHRAFSDAPWAMSEDTLKPLDAVFEVLQPSGVEDRVRWLFRPGASQIGPNIDFGEEQAELRQKQCEAAEHLLVALNTDQLFAFALTVTMQRDLGIAIANATVSDERKHEFMKRGIQSSATEEAEVGLGVMYGLKVSAGPEGEAWIQGLWRKAIAEHWGGEAELRIVQALPVNALTWKQIETHSATLSDAYWRALTTYWIPGEADAGYVVDHLLEIGRAIDAVSWLGHHIKRKHDSQLLIRVLRAAAAGQALDRDATMFSHYVGLMLDYLESDASVSERDIVGLEWTYFQALCYSRRSVKSLHRALACDPEFFVYLIKLIYLPEEDSGIVEPEPTDIDKAQGLASQAYDVMHHWAHVPGADDEGQIDGNALELWVKQARKLLSEAGRTDIGESKIGEILAAAKRTPDQPWPPVPVREMIELVRSRTMERGFEIGVYNRRGVTVRMPHDGGEQERALAERYRGDASELRFDWPRTAACLERIAETYELDANREDISTEQRDWL